MNVFAGHFHEVLDASRDLLNIDLVVVEERNYAGSEVEKRVIDYGLDVIRVSNDREVFECLNQKDNIEKLVVAGFGVVLGQKSISCCKDIINFHPGDVYCCRGRHPLPATIYMGFSNATWSVHRIIDDGIDTGPLISQMSIALDFERSYFHNERRLRAYLYAYSRSIFEEWMSHGSLPDWTWEPKFDSYHQAFSAEDLSLLMSLDKISEFTKDIRRCK